MKKLVRNRIITGLIFTQLILLSCSERIYHKNQLIPKNTSGVEKGYYGSYMEVQSKMGDETGEFIAYNDSILYLMTTNRLVSFPLDDLIKIKITLVENRAKNYALITGIGLTPNLIGALIHQDYTENFLGLGLFASIFGGLAILVESQRDPHVVTYPDEKTDIRDLQKYARFPAGIPEGLDLNILQPPAF